MKRRSPWLLSLFLFSCDVKDAPRVATHNGPGGPLEAPTVRAQQTQEAFHSVFSLRDNQHLAHQQRNQWLFIPASGPGFAKYLHFARPSNNWKLSQTLEGRKGATPEPKAAIEFPLTQEQAKSANNLLVRLYAPSPRKLNIKANGKAAGTTELTSGWQTANIALSAKLNAGDNTVSFDFSKMDGLFVEWVQLGGETTESAPQIFSKKDSILLTEGEGVSYYVQIPKDGRLIGDIIGEKSCEVLVSAASSGGEQTSGSLQGKNSFADLSSLSEKIVRLDLKARGCKELQLQNASLAAPGEAKQVERAKPPKYIVLWVMDTLRGDKLRIINPNAKPEIPVFEEMAKSATVFASAYSQGNESRAGHASIWTSLYPVNHRMIHSKARLAPELITLDEAMKSAGFFTSGVSCNGYITDKWGFGNTWDKYRNHIHDGGGVGGKDVMGAAIKSVKEKKDKPFFLYIGTVDTHVSWRAHEPWLSQYDPEPYDGPWKKIITGKSVEDAVSGKLKINQRDKVRAMAFYDANVSYQDFLVGELLKTLKEWGIADETMLVFSADHGEEMWEEGRQSHGATQRETEVHVPLVIYYPPLFPAGKVIEGADTLDIIPTMLDAMGQKIPEVMQGESLIPLAQGVTQGYPRPAFSSMYERQHTMRLAGWKMDVTSSGEVSLYDLSSKERELKNLSQAKPIEKRFLTDALSTFLVYQKKWKKWKWGVASNVTAQFSQDIE